MALSSANLSKMPSANQIIDAACAVLKIPRKKVEFSLNIVTPAKMQGLNVKHRSKNKPTDVLSFPLLTKSEVSTLLKKDGILELGDIFINREEPAERFTFLVVHGFLHLLGYDHERSKKNEKVMFALQDEITNYMRN